MKNVFVTIAVMAVMSMLAFAGVVSGRLPNDPGTIGMFAIFSVAAIIVVVSGAKEKVKRG